MVQWWMVLAVITVALEGGKSTEACPCGQMTTVRHVGEVELRRLNCSVVTLWVLWTSSGLKTRSL